MPRIRISTISPRLLPLLLALVALSCQTDTSSDLPPDAASGGELSARVEDAAPSGSDLLPPPAPSWERIGPRNVYNEINDNGFAGTTADAVADRELPGTFYTGGSNNSAASGVLKSTDGGKHWNRASVGLADPRIFALRADPTDAAVLHAGTPSGIFRSVDRAAHWALESGTAAFGLTRLFVEGQGSFQGWLFAATDHGIAYRAAGATGWAVSAAPGNAAIYFIAFSAPTPGTGTLYAVNNGDLYRVTVDAKALSFNWAKTASQGNTVTVDPGNVDHILFSHRGTGSADDYAVMESVDGGRTSKRLGNHTCWYVSFDPDDATGKKVWAAGQNGGFHSEDGGKTFTETTWSIESRDGYSFDQTGFDIQRIIFRFGGTVAFASDQGLVRYAGNDQLEALDGDLRIHIVVSVAVSHALDGTTSVLTTLWDAGPTASWDGGATWQATSWYGSQFWYGDGSGAPPVGEGGQVWAMRAALDGKPHAVLLTQDSRSFWSADGGHSFAGGTLPKDDNVSPSMRFHTFDHERDVKGVASGVSYFLADAGNHVRLYRSADYGKSWMPSGALLPAARQMTLATEPGTPKRVYLGSDSTIAVSTDGGVTFGPPLAVGGTARILRLAMRPDGQRLLALYDDGKLYRSDDLGQTFQPVGDTTFQKVTGLCAPQTYQLAYSPSGRTVAFACGGLRPGATSPHILSTSDDGASWKDRTLDALSVQINGIAWDGPDLYVATSGESILRQRNLE